MPHHTNPGSTWKANEVGEGNSVGRGISWTELSQAVQRFHVQSNNVYTYPIHGIIGLVRVIYCIMGVWKCCLEWKVKSCQKFLQKCCRCQLGAAREYYENIFQIQNLLVVSSPLKNISQNGNLPQIGVKIKHIGQVTAGSVISTEPLLASMGRTLEPSPHKSYGANTLSTDDMLTRGSCIANNGVLNNESTLHLTSWTCF